MRRRAVGDRFSWLALAIIACLVGISLVSQRNADWYSGNAFYDSQMVWYLIGGVIFSWLYVQYRSVWVAWVAHAIADVAIFAIAWQLIVGF